jgi:hypothetical protein
MAETAKEAFDRGETAGQIAERLAGHDRHFAAINGSLERIANEMHAMSLTQQALSTALTNGLRQIADQQTERDRTVLTTAKALKDAEEARRDKTEQSWSPFQRLFAVLGALAAVAAVIGGLLASR